MSTRKSDTFGAAVGRRLRTLRHQRRMSLDHVAARMGVHRTFVSQIETHGKNMHIDTIRRYCVAIGAEIHIRLKEAP